MLPVLATTFPIFAAICIGYALVGLRVFSPADMRVLGRFVMTVAFPALALHAVASRDLGEVIHWGYLTAVTIGGVATFAIAYMISAATGVGPARRAIAGMGASLPNSAYVGFPLMMTVLPDRAGQVLALNFLVENFVLIILTMTLLETSRPDRGSHLPAAVAKALWALLRMPFMLGLLAGLAISALDLPYPGPLSRLAEILAASASAVALVVIGGTLYGLPMRGDRVLATMIAGAKLLLHPAIMALAVMALPALGLAPLPDDLRLAAILSAAMPMIAVSVVLAQPYGHDGLASISLLLATTASFVTISLILALLG